MKKPLQFLLWTFVFLCLLVFIDQALTRISIQAPVLSPLQEFYRDFRSRLLGTGLPEPAREIPPPAQPVKKPSPLPAVSTDQPRFIYVDRDGQLQFADSLEEIPTEFRGKAQKLAQ